VETTPANTSICPSAVEWRAPASGTGTERPPLSPLPPCMQHQLGRVYASIRYRNREAATIPAPDSISRGTTGASIRYRNRVAAMQHQRWNGGRQHQVQSQSSRHFPCSSHAASAGEGMCQYQVQEQRGRDYPRPRPASISQGTAIASMRYRNRVATTIPVQASNSRGTAGASIRYMNREAATKIPAPTIISWGVVTSASIRYRKRVAASSANQGVCIIGTGVWEQRKL